MTMPAAPDQGMAQVLIKLGEMGAQLAAIDERLKAVPDHETRIRALEKWRYSLPISLVASIGSIILAIWKATGR